MSDVTCTAVFSKPRSAKNWFYGLNGASMRDPACEMRFFQPGDDKNVLYIQFSATGYGGHEHSCGHVNFALLNAKASVVTFTLRAAGPEARHLGQGNPARGLQSFINLLRVHVRRANGSLTVDEDELAAAERHHRVTRAVAEAKENALRAWEASAAYRRVVQQRLSAQKQFEEATRQAEEAQRRLQEVGDRIDRERDAFVNSHLRGVAAGSHRVRLTFT